MAGLLQASEAWSAYHQKFRAQQFQEQGGYGADLKIDYKAAISQYFEDKLKDPDSAHVKISPPRKGWFREAWVLHADGFRYVFGWEVAVKIKRLWRGIAIMACMAREISSEFGLNAC
jgi:hypothetical protein